jgi:hypothetical protein
VASCAARHEVQLALPSVCVRATQERHSPGDGGHVYRWRECSAATWRHQAQTVAAAEAAAAAQTSMDALVGAAAAPAADRRQLAQENSNLVVPWSS